MTSDVKIQRLVFLTLLSILGFAVIISNVTYSQKNYPELHEKTIDEIVKHSMSEQNPSISVEDEPWKIVVNEPKIRVKNNSQPLGPPFWP